MGYTTDHEQQGHSRPNTLRVTVRQSESKTRKGYHDERTARKWLYVRLPPRVFQQCGLDRGDVAEVTLYFPPWEERSRPQTWRNGVINIRKEMLADE